MRPVHSLESFRSYTFFEVGAVPGLWAALKNLLKLKLRDRDDELSGWL